MGVHIVIKNAEGERHPTWDWIRYGNDTEFAYMLLREEKTFVVDGSWGEWVGFRPVDIDGLREVIIECGWSNQERYLGLCDILEGDEQWLVRI